MAAVNLIGSYNYALVALSVLIATFASYAALDLAGRVTAAGGWTRAIWLLGGAGAMGTGIWSMHYIGMLAFILPIPVAYHWPTVLLSLFAAILASVVALGVVSRQKMGWFRALAGSVLMGAGIASMHYIGMAAMRLPAVCQFNSFLVVLSVVFAVLISLAALWITFHFRDRKTGTGWQKLSGAVVMGAAIPVMHYTGMAAASFTPSGAPTDLSHAVSISTLGTAGIAAATFIVLGLALLTSWVDRQFATEALEVQEEKLQRSEAYLAEAQRLSHTGSFGWRPSTGEILCSEETFRVFDYDRATKPTVELILQRVHPEDMAFVRQTIERAAQDGKDFDFENRLLMPDGSVKYVHVVSHALNDVSGSVEFVGAVMDITAARQAEEALRRSESYLAEAQRLTHTGSWAFDAIKSLYWSEENFRIWGFDPQLGLPDHETASQRIHPEDRGRVVGCVQNAVRERRDYAVEFRIVLPDGAVRYILGLGHPAFSPSGELVEVVGTDVDVTDRKRAEEALRRSEGYLAEAQRLTRTGSWAWSVATRHSVYWSQENYRLFGFDPEGGIPSDEAFYQRIHPEDRDRVRREVFLERPDEGSHFDVEFRIVLPDGAIKYVRSTGHPVRNISGDLLEYVGTSIDVTERKRADEERERLRQAQADLAHVNRVTTMGELTASLAHEVNQPIAAAITDAKTCMRWLAADTPNLEEARAAAMRIITDGTRAAEIIKRTRLLFKKGTPERELVDVNEVVREMVVLLHNEATRCSISIQMDLVADLPQVLGDRVQLQQVLMNLMMNGIDAMKDMDGRRELVVQSHGAENNQLQVSVSDTGVGLPPNQADQIFSAFFTTKLHGTGMGLRISRSIVESHGGRLWAEENSPRGASFCFTLPIKAEAPE
jgi:PAS domain S-box-containing protein